MDSSKSKKSILEKDFRRWQLLLPAVLCVIGIALNIGGKIMGEYAHVPLHLDNAGTIIVAALGGYLPGIATAFFTNLITYTNDPLSIYFSPLSIAIAIITAYAYSKGKLSKAGSLAAYILIITLVSLLVGTTTEWVLYGTAKDDGSQPIIALLQGWGLGNFEAWLIVKFIAELADKIFVVAFIKTILYLIPRKLWSKFHMTLWMQNPDSTKKEDGTEGPERRYTRGLPLNAKLVSILVTITLLVALSGTVICLILFRNYSIQQHTYLTQGVAKMAASVVDGNSVDIYLANGDDFESYRETKRLLAELQSSIPDLQYVYVYKIMSDGCHVVFDVDPDDQTYGSELGTVIPFDKSFMAVVPDLLSGKRIEPIISDDAYGWLLTAYEPVYNSNGECVCYAAADVSMSGLAMYEFDFFYQQLCFFIGFLALIISATLWFARYQLLIPINTMSRITAAFGYDDEFARRGNVHKLEQLDIGTGDEVEVLYRALLETTKESTQFFEENKENNEKISALQNGLVLVLADMVENRDGSTGDHVRKTAAYVNLTAKKMQELGYYKDKLTDQFIDDITRSAPLHDIGKIAIPDAVLNAPRKLTDEEFEIMKTHAARGREVIEQVIASIPDADYLEEAKNVAGYHHEKWNGKGYPEGLAGEDIPLAARIMAVADVFDALVSKRCYKESFDYDKAFGIIKEDAGRHFDPLVVDAFVKAREEVLEIAERFKENDGKVV